MDFFEDGVQLSREDSDSLFECGTITCISAIWPQRHQMEQVVLDRNRRGNPSL